MQPNLVHLFSRVELKKSMLSKSGMAYDLNSLLPAQEWLLEAVSIAGMKVSATVLQKMTNDFNLDDNKTKQQMLKEWKLLSMRHDFMGTKAGETEIINRFITYVYTVIKDSELKNDLINHKDEGVDLGPQFILQQKEPPCPLLWQRDCGRRLNQVPPLASCCSNSGLAA